MENTHQSALIMCKISLQILSNVIKGVNSVRSGGRGDPEGPQGRARLHLSGLFLKGSCLTVHPKPKQGTQGGWTLRWCRQSSRLPRGKDGPGHVTSQRRASWVCWLQLRRECPPAPGLVFIHARKGNRSFSRAFIWTGKTKSRKKKCP